MSVVITSQRVAWAYGFDGMWCESTGTEGLRPVCRIDGNRLYWNDPPGQWANLQLEPPDIFILNREPKKEARRGTLDIAGDIVWADGKRWLRLDNNQTPTNVSRWISAANTNTGSLGAYDAWQIPPPNSASPVMVAHAVVRSQSQSHAVIPKAPSPRDVETSRHQMDRSESWKSLQALGDHMGHTRDTEMNRFGTWKSLPESPMARDLRLPDGAFGSSPSLRRWTPGSSPTAAKPNVGTPSSSPTAATRGGLPADSARNRLKQALQDKDVAAAHAAVNEYLGQSRSPQSGASPKSGTSPKPEPTGWHREELIKEVIELRMALKVSQSQSQQSIGLMQQRDELRGEVAAAWAEVERVRSLARPLYRQIGDFKTEVQLAEEQVARCTFERDLAVGESADLKKDYGYLQRQIQAWQSLQCSHCRHNVTEMCEVQEFLEMTNSVGRQTTPVQSPDSSATIHHDQSPYSATRQSPAGTPNSTIGRMPSFTQYGTAHEIAAMAQPYTQYGTPQQIGRMQSGTLSSVGSSDMSTERHTEPPSHNLTQRGFPGTPSIILDA